MGSGGMAWAVLTPPLQLYSQASIAWACVLICKLESQAELLCGGHSWYQLPQINTLDGLVLSVLQAMCLGVRTAQPGLPNFLLCVVWSLLCAYLKRGGAPYKGTNSVGSEPHSSSWPHLTEIYS